MLTIQLGQEWSSSSEFCSSMAKCGHRPVTASGNLRSSCLPKELGLRQKRVSSSYRNSFGHGIDAACGQLFAGYEEVASQVKCLVFLTGI